MGRVLFFYFTPKQAFIFSMQATAADLKQTLQMSNKD